MSTGATLRIGPRTGSALRLSHEHGGDAAAAAAVHGADDPGDDGNGNHYSRHRTPNNPASHAPRRTQTHPE